MSDLRPTGIMIKLEEETHNLLFTLNVVDALQSRYHCSVSEVLVKLTDNLESPGVIRFVLTELLNDEMKRLGKNKVYEEEETGRMVSVKKISEVKTAIIRCYGLSIPDCEEEEKQDNERELLDIAGLLLIAATKMGYTEEEVFKMTPRKFFLLFDKFLELNGKKKKEFGIDDLP